MSAGACRRSLRPPQNLVRKPAQLTVDGCDALAPRRQGRVRRLRDVCGEQQQQSGWAGCKPPYQLRPTAVHAFWAPQSLPTPPVILGVILAHTGTVALALIQPHTSYRISQSWGVQHSVAGEGAETAGRLGHPAVPLACVCWAFHTPGAQSYTQESREQAAHSHLRCAPLPPTWPMAMPILRSGMPWGQEKLISKASTPVSWHRSISSSH